VGFAWFLLAYHVVLAVQTLRARSACSASRADARVWTAPLRRGSPRHRAISPDMEMSMSRTTLYTNDSSTATGIREASFEEILTAAREQMSLRVRRGTSLSSPKATRDYLALKLGTLEREVFAVIFLDLCGVLTYVRLFGWGP
jgi:hypothetical protein